MAAGTVPIRLLFDHYSCVSTSTGRANLSAGAADIRPPPASNHTCIASDDMRTRVAFACSSRWYAVCTCAAFHLPRNSATIFSSTTVAPRGFVPSCDSDRCSFATAICRVVCARLTTRWNCALRLSLFTTAFHARFVPGETGLAQEAFNLAPIGARCSATVSHISKFRFLCISGADTDPPPTAGTFSFLSISAHVSHCLRYRYLSVEALTHLECISCDTAFSFQ